VTFLYNDNILFWLDHAYHGKICLFIDGDSYLKCTFEFYLILMYNICLFWVYFIMMSFYKLSTLLSVGMHIVIPQSTTVSTGVKEDGVQRHWMVLKASYDKSHSANFTKSGIVVHNGQIVSGQ
jgi:hypothetical protein